MADDNLRGFLGIKRMDARIKELCGVKKGLKERIDEGVLRCYGRVERMESNRITKRLYVEEWAGSRSVCRPRRRWIDTL